jgi:hypothetical protein
MVAARIVRPHLIWQGGHEMEDDSRDAERQGTDAAPRGDRLDRVLARALPAPNLPVAFHATLLRAIEAEAAHELHARQRLLDAEHEEQLRQLRSGYLRLRRNTVLTIAAAAFTGGAALSAGLPRLSAWSGLDGAILAPALVALLFLGACGAFLAERFGFVR